MARIAEVLLHDGIRTTYGVADTFEFVYPDKDDWPEIRKGDGTAVSFAPHSVVRVNVYDEAA